MERLADILARVRTQRTRDREKAADRGRRLVPEKLSAPNQEVGCPVCKGSGYLRAEVPVGHPFFGKAQPCTCTLDRRVRRLRERLFALSRLDGLVLFRETSFSNFDYRLPGVQEAYEAAVRFAEQPEGWLALVGDNGCGKTHLAVSIARVCLEQERSVLFAVVPDLLDHLRAAFAPGADEPYDELFTLVREVEVLVLDDLGAERSSDWTDEKLYQVLNFRYNGRLPTVITTNRYRFGGIDGRIHSRLCDRRLCRVIEMFEAGDYRQADRG